MRLYLLDTNMASYIFSGKSQAARAHLDDLAGIEQACISAISEAELYHGVAKSGSLRHRNALDLFLKRMPVRPWDSDAAIIYGRLHAELQRSGKALGPLDMQIAAHAIALGATLVTRDGVFRQISALQGLESCLENWATDL